MNLSVDYNRQLQILSNNYALTISQWENYWKWFKEISSPSFPYNSEKDLFEYWFNELKNNKPLSQIQLQWGFYKDLFFVSPDVLTPRPETEMLVDLSLKEIKNHTNILEIGVGSGALILSIMLNSKHGLNVLGTDISEHALKIAKKNYDAKKMKLKNHTFNLLKADRVNGIKRAFFDLIVSNPPYIPKNYPGVTDQVRQFEPSVALFIEENIYIDWMNDLLLGILDCLKFNGIAFIEGHEDWLSIVGQSFLERTQKENLPLKEISILKDLNGLNRFIKFQKSSGP